MNNISKTLLAIGIAMQSGAYDSHIDEIEKADPEIKKNLYLYHYNEEPQVDESQYRGILRTGDVHNY